ncbi:MAG: sugar transferase, partial [Candidatus Heimdallarchaeota archaeon]|nr:sugar transferase [Candidatus Heimdallarchaeota archaeon]
PGLIGLSQMTSFYKKIKPGLEVEIELDSKYLDEMSLSLDFRIMINSLSLTLVRMFRGKT